MVCHNTRISVGIIDDHAVVREGISHILSRAGDMFVAFEGATSDDAIHLTSKHKPHLLLLDLGIPGSALSALRAIKKDHPEVYCVMFTSSEDPILAMSALTHGASGYILKGIDANDLIAALRSILDNHSYVSPEFATRLISAATPNGSANAGLSTREEQIIKHVERGMTNRQIAQELHLSEQTIKFYMTNVMQKYGVSNRVSAVREYNRTYGRHTA